MDSEFFSTQSNQFLYESMKKKKKKTMNMNMRRFSDEQVRSLETIFECETKLEPRKKLELAKELGLQPRQVAIWFQNKRARWRSKQLERDYSLLTSNYTALSSQFQTLQNEKQCLLLQLQKLNDLVNKSKEETSEPQVEVGIDIVEANKECEDGEVKSTPSLERSENGIPLVSDEDSCVKAEYFGLDMEPQLTSMMKSADGSSFTSPENWENLPSDDLLRQQSGGSSYQWWDFWT